MKWLIVSLVTAAAGVTVAAFLIRRFRRMPEDKRLELFRRWFGDE